MKSLIICACEKVIIDKTNGAHSLISIMRLAEAKVAIPSRSEPSPLPEEVPANAVAPNLWFIYTMWDTAPDEASIAFEQVTEVYWPNGEVFVINRLPFTADEKLIAQNSVGFLGFPMGQVGKIKILVWIEQNNNRVSDVIDYEITVRHSRNV